MTQYTIEVEADLETERFLSSADLNDMVGAVAAQLYEYGELPSGVTLRAENDEMEAEHVSRT